jgi:predicted RND superfamily exporter protein
MLGALFILDDPIFNGLAISLIFGIFVSTLLTLVVIPVLYCKAAIVAPSCTGRRSPQALRPQHRRIASADYPARSPVSPAVRVPGYVAGCTRDGVPG